MQQLNLAGGSVIGEQLTGLLCNGGPLYGTTYFASHCCGVSRSGVATALYHAWLSEACMAEASTGVCMFSVECKIVTCLLMPFCLCVSFCLSCVSDSGLTVATLHAVCKDSSAAAMVLSSCCLQ